MSEAQVRGRFAPSPSGRMHLGNVYAALMSWLSVKAKGGKWVLRIEDLDPQRSRYEYARQIEDDLLWLGLEWDEGGLDAVGASGPYCQSKRAEYYEEALQSLISQGLVYPCKCTRADIRATQAPHQSDGRVVYAGSCRPHARPPFSVDINNDSKEALRLWVEDRDISFVDGRFGLQSFNLAEECGDFVLRRADGAWAYQLAVAVDDALMGITEVVRGSDLLPSTAQQLYILELLGHRAPHYTHLPLLVNDAGQRLSKRDGSLAMDELRKVHTPESLLGELAFRAGVIRDAEAVSVEELLERYKEKTL